MKKTLISTAVVAAVVVLGGGYYLWPATDNSPRVSETKSVVSKNKASQKQSSTAAEKKAATSSSASEQSTVTGSTSSNSTASSTSSSANGSATSQSTSSSKAMPAKQDETTSSSGSAVTSTQSSVSQLTTAQVNDWAWQQVAPQYQNTKAVKQDFSFNQYQQAGLVYVEVYENQNSGVAHLAGRFRVNAQGQLEQQQLAQGDVWQVVATSPTN